VIENRNRNRNRKANPSSIIHPPGESFPTGGGHSFPTWGIFPHRGRSFHSPPGGTTPLPQGSKSSIRGDPPTGKWASLSFPRGDHYTFSWASQLSPKVDQPVLNRASQSSLRGDHSIPQWASQLFQMRDHSIRKWASQPSKSPLTSIPCPSSRSVHNRHITGPLPVHHRPSPAQTGLQHVYQRIPLVHHWPISKHSVHHRLITVPSPVFGPSRPMAHNPNAKP